MYRYVPCLQCAGSSPERYSQSQFIAVGKDSNIPDAGQGSHWSLYAYHCSAAFLKVNHLASKSMKLNQLEGNLVEVGWRQNWLKGGENGGRLESL